MLETINTINAMRDRLRAVRNGSLKVGLVPTMGYLHDGHASLFRAARKQCDFVVISVFVNPIQFDCSDDYTTYPINVDHDARLCAEYDVDIIFAPDVSEMYPQYSSAGDGPLTLTKVCVAGITRIMCGQSRPSYFDGVATVVMKLFNIIQPDVAYFGLKDAQQVAVIQRMVIDLNVPIEIVVCPTVRDAVDDLALSSRNVHLTSDERRMAANLLPVAIREALLEAGKPGATVCNVLDVMKTRFESHTSVPRVDYVEAAYYPSMLPLNDVQMRVSDAEGPFVIAFAIFIGKTRLIDNVVIDAKGNTPAITQLNW